MVEPGILVFGFLNFDLPYGNQPIFCKERDASQNEGELFFILNATLFNIFLGKVDLVMTDLIPFGNPEIESSINIFVYLLSHLRHKPLLTVSPWYSFPMALISQVKFPMLRTLHAGF